MEQNKRGPKPGFKAPIKYRGPNGETWSGRGKMAGWLVKLIEAGHDRDEYFVKQNAVD